MMTASLPRLSSRLLRGFRWYSRRYLQRHFHAIRLLRSASPPSEINETCVVFLNHASWWDPLVALFLAQRFQPRQQAFGPIDEAALNRYGFLRKVGFFPVEQGTRRGARQFLHHSQAILSRPGNCLWITPQGEFSDVRERPIRFVSGLAHLAKRVPEVPMIPVAIEFTWWFERTPEILIAFGDPVFGSGRRCEEALTAVQDRLAAASQARDPAAFITLLSGRAGVGGIYDTWRSFKSRLRGEAFVPNHQPADFP